MLIELWRVSYLYWCVHATPKQRNWLCQLTASLDSKCLNVALRSYIQFQTNLCAHNHLALKTPSLVVFLSFSTILSLQMWVIDQSVFQEIWILIMQGKYKKQKLEFLKKWHGEPCKSQIFVEAMAGRYLSYSCDLW